MMFQVLAFRDITPQGPVHILLIPKVRDGLTGLSKVHISLYTSLTKSRQKLNKCTAIRMAVVGLDPAKKHKLNNVLFYCRLRKGTLTSWAAFSTLPSL